MPNRFCAICGKKLEDNYLHFGMCHKCYLKENPLFELPKSLSLNICLDCGSYSKKEVWSETSENDIFIIIREALFRYLLIPIKKKNGVDFSISFLDESFTYSSKELLISLEVDILGCKEDNLNITHHQLIKLLLNHILCKNCSNLRGGTYFLSILQLRVKDVSYFSLLDPIIRNINEHVENLFKTDQRQYISKIEDQKFGVDLYLSTNELMNYIIRFLKRNHHFLLKRSKKLTGRDSQKGRNLYRFKTVIKFLPITINEEIIIENQSYLVESITKNKVILRNENNTKLIKDYSYFFNEKFVKITR
jgi:NMD protein affecting ribosome stability and mRNA decay